MVLHARENTERRSAGIFLSLYAFNSPFRWVGLQRLEVHKSWFVLGGAVCGFSEEGI